MEKYLLIPLDKSFITLDSLNTSGKCLFIKENFFFNKAIELLNINNKTEILIENIIHDLISSLHIDDVLDSDDIFHEVLKNKLTMIIIELNNLIEEHKLFTQYKNLRYHMRASKTNAVFKWVSFIT